jgi:MOB kinase activator 1
MMRTPSRPNQVLSNASHTAVTSSQTCRVSGQDFPASFPSTIKHVYRQLLRVFAHIYHAHYPQILHLRSEPHFNSLFAHFLAFGREYELLDVKDVRGAGNAQAVGIGALWERWREMGILES